LRNILPQRYRPLRTEPEPNQSQSLPQRPDPQKGPNLQAERAAIRDQARKMRLERFRPVMARERAGVINLDCTIFCAARRIGPVAAEMRANIAAGIGCELDRVNVKGKTNDGFGPEGQGEAISATVLVQLGVETGGE
jgi:2-C-methyl-D-erythritol 2,4-cyclodiphosphate synthase